MLGWIKLHRQIKDHWIWKSDNRLKWWIDILLTVNHAPKKVLIKGTLLDCDRGQTIKSLQSWAKDWNVSKKTVSDFFKLLQKDSMIFSENLKITTRITVCNYDTYNDSVNAKETLSKRKVNAKETLSKRNLPTNKNDKNENNENNENNEKETGLHPFARSPFFDFQKLYSEIDPKYHKYDLKYYHSQMKNYSESSGKMYKCWLAACRAWINRDVKDGKAKLVTTVNGQKNVLVLTDDEKNAGVRIDNKYYYSPLVGTVLISNVEKRITNGVRCLVTGVPLYSI